MISSHKKTVGLVGARGHTGSELLQLLQNHSLLELIFASSRELAGQSLAQAIPGISLPGVFEDLNPEQVAIHAPDICILALPNGVARPFVSALERHSPKTVIIDLSADYRFDPGWYYGLPELTRQHAPAATRIANPGCYATAMQLAIAPLKDLLAGPVHCMGISGFSGAGTTPSPKNDPDVLRDNILPYASTGHIHEREVSYQLQTTVRFMPHVAAHFRGISMTVCASFSEAQSSAQLAERYAMAYAHEPLIKLQSTIPYVRDNANLHHATIGGWAVADNGSYGVVYATLDNLLKGAATQAMQNINLACGYNELEGIPHD
jgi:N-acetyl-gamma-glutamyl-phosphate reductase